MKSRQTIESMTENRKGDSVRKEFAYMYETSLAHEEIDDLSEEDGQILRVLTMVDVTMRVRKDLHPELAAELEKEQFLNSYREYLYGEFKIFEFARKPQAAQFFAEYLLWSTMDKFDAEKIIDFNFLKEKLNEAYNNAPYDDKALIDDLRRIYPWGSLIQ